MENVVAPPGRHSAVRNTLSAKTFLVQLQKQDSLGPGEWLLPPRTTFLSPVFSHPPPLSLSARVHEVQEKSTAKSSGARCTPLHAARRVEWCPPPRANQRTRTRASASVFIMPNNILIRPSVPWPGPPLRVRVYYVSERDTCALCRRRRIISENITHVSDWKCNTKRITGLVLPHRAH